MPKGSVPGVRTKSRLLNLVSIVTLSVIGPQTQAEICKGSESLSERQRKRQPLILLDSEACQISEFAQSFRNVARQLLCDKTNV